MELVEQLKHVYSYNEIYEGVYREDDQLCNNHQ